MFLIPVTRIQFIAIELARNRRGLNAIHFENGKTEGKTDIEAATKNIDMLELGEGVVTSESENTIEVNGKSEDAIEVNGNIQDPIDLNGKGEDAIELNGKIEDAIEVNGKVEDTIEVNGNDAGR